MVLVAIRSVSTLGRFGVQREIARTILFISTGSNEPLRLRTRIVVWAVSSVWRAAVVLVPMYVSITLIFPVKMFFGVGEALEMSGEDGKRRQKVLEPLSRKCALRSYPLCDVVGEKGLG